MFSKFVRSFRSKGSPDKDVNRSQCESEISERYAYIRPTFLGLSSDEDNIFDDHESRTIITPKENSQQKLPCCAGYAECINGGKSLRNEDQATAGRFVLPSQPNGVIDQENSIDVRYFCIFDGHAGTGAALMAAEQFVNHLQEKLMNVVDFLLTLSSDDTFTNLQPDKNSYYDVTVDSIVRGAIEAAFISFDEHIATESKSFVIDGGCTAIMVLILLDRIFVANAGDCRVVGYIGDEIIQLSQEFTPETDAERIQYLAHTNPSLTHGVFSENCYYRVLRKKDIGTQLLYRPPQSSGWHCKTIAAEDVDHPPLVAGRGKWARLMGVIGVTRGFGDHSLKVPATDISVKAFMTAMPEIQILNIEGKSFEYDDVLLMGSDGLWDFVPNEDLKEVVRASLNRQKEQDDKEICYNTVARDAVHYSRGDNSGRGWKMSNGQDASFDDISAFVIPLKHVHSYRRKVSKELLKDE